MMMVLTPMLDALEKNYTKATFFCLGQNAGYYPETVQREYNLGMEVGTHTYSHVVLTSLSASALDSEISKSVDAINKAIGVKPSFIFPKIISFYINFLLKRRLHRI